MPILESITKWSATVTDPATAGTMVHDADRHRRRTRTAGRCSSTSRSTCSARRRATSRRPTRHAVRGVEPDPDAVAAPRRADRRRRAAGVRRRQRRLLGRRLGRAGAPPSSTCAFPCSPTASGGARCPPTTSWRSCARRGLLKQRADLVVVARHAARLPPRVRPVRVGGRRPRRRRRVAAGRTTSTCPPSPATSRRRSVRLAEHAGDRADPRGVDRRAARRRGGSPRRRGAAARRRRRADQADPGLRRAAPAPRPRRRRDLRRRRLRLLRRQVRRGVRARVLAGHRAVRVPRQRPRLLDRGQASPAPTPRSSPCSATARPGSA